MTIAVTLKVGDGDVRSGVPPRTMAIRTVHGEQEYLIPVVGHKQVDWPSQTTVIAAPLRPSN